MSPFYGGGRAPREVFEFMQGQVVLEVTLDGNVKLWAETTSGAAPVLTPADCEEIGNALAALSTPTGP